MESLKEKISVVQPTLPPFDEYISEISDLWETKWLTHTGPKHQQLEKELQEYLDVDAVSLFSNGHMALELAIQALDLSGEIITTPFTFVSTTQAIMRNGIEPVFCDINDKDYTIDVRAIEELITNKTTAIIPVHVYGNACDVTAIESIAEKYGLKVIYDAAHAFGMKVNGKGIANYGDMSMFSFHATKVFNTVEGGAIASNQNTYKQILSSLRQFGQIVGTDETPIVGTNAKMTEIHAAMGLCNLRHVNESIEKRKSLVKIYRELLGDVEGITLCKEQENVVHNYAYFPVVFDPNIYGRTRDEVAAALEKNNIFARKYFYPLTSEFEMYRKKYGGDRVHVPVAQKISRNVLTLPLYSELRSEQVEMICNVIKKRK